MLIYFQVELEFLYIIKIVNNILEWENELY